MEINRMHFIWMGALISEEKVRNIIKWRDLLEKQSKGRVYVVLWTDRVQETIELADDSNYVNALVMNVDQLDEMLANLDEKVTKPGVLGSQVSLKEGTWNRLKAYARDNRDQSYTGRNYGISSDIYRLALLYECGGVYMDCDNTPVSTFKSKYGTEGEWDIPSGKIIWHPGYGNSYIVAPQQTEALIYILMDMALKRDYLDTLTHTKSDLYKYSRMTEDAITTGETDKTKEDYDEAYVLHMAWHNLIQNYMSERDEITAFEMQRYFPSVYPGPNQVRLELNEEGKVYWNPRFKYTTTTTGPSQFTGAVYGIKDYTQESKTIELTGWVQVGSAHEWT